MIIYEHTPILLRLVQWKGTVLQDTFSHVILVNIVTLLASMFVRIDGAVVWPSWDDRPDWVPEAVETREVSSLWWQLLMLPLGFLLGLRSNQAYGAEKEELFRSMCTVPCPVVCC
jgi:hypothetical protein